MKPYSGNVGPPCPPPAIARGRTRNLYSTVARTTSRRRRPCRPICKMAYNPFAPSGDGNARRYAKPPRWPPIFETKLTSLEWGKADSSRKRHRPESESTRRRPDTSRSEPDWKRADSTRSDRPRTAPEPASAVTTTNTSALPPVAGLTIMGGPPILDDRIRVVMNFMLAHVRAPDVEIEAKVGTVFEKASNGRAAEMIPVQCATPVLETSNGDIRFESAVDMSIFSALNTVLNQRVNDTAVSGGVGKVEYTRTKEVDVYWPGRVRETRVADSSSGRDVFRTERVQTKKRLADINFICPGGSFDVRYSASVERDASIPAGASPTKQRSKDRISYKFEYISVDITMVKMNEGGQETLTHEVEVEVEDAKRLYEEVCKYNGGDQSSKLCAIAISLVHTVNIILEEIENAIRSLREQQERQGMQNGHRGR